MSITPPARAEALSISLWRFSLSQADTLFSWANSLLSMEETEKAAKFCKPQDGRRFTLCRACVKHILASYRKGVRAQDILFSYGLWGKPQWRDLSFSISHSGTQALLAVCEEYPVGCDIEFMEEDKNLRGIANFFHPREQDALARIPSENYAATFYRMWVRKEAVMKACGRGLGLGIDQVLVSGQEQEKMAVILTEPAGDKDKKNWYAPTFMVDNRFVLAVAFPEKAGQPSILQHVLDVPFKG